MKFKKIIKRDKTSIELIGELIREATPLDKKKSGINQEIPCVIVKYTIANYTYWGIWKKGDCVAA